MKISRKILAAKIRLLALGGIMAHASPVWSGIPVADGVNLPQNIISAIEAVAHTAKQIQQYQTQLQQYENALQNTMAPAAYIWDQAQSTINELTQATNTLTYYQNQLGSLDAYLSKFQEVAYYRSSPCFNGSGGCTPAEQFAMEENRRLASESQKKPTMRYSTTWLSNKTTYKPMPVNLSDCNPPLKEPTVSWPLSVMQINLPVTKLTNCYKSAVY